MTKKNKNNNNEKEVKKIIKNKDSRVGATKGSHLWFFYTYLPDYVQYEIADFHKEMFAITEDDKIKLAAICSFRGSGKSTLITLGFPIWAILGRMQCKFVVIISQTAEQAKLHFKNLKRELETNELLKRDLGPFQELKDEWNSCSLVVSNYNAKIIAVSKEQSFRGIKHGPHRPDLIIADDVENSDSIRTKESRDNTYNWFTSEVLPLGSQKTKKIVIGNLLHEDSLLKRLEEEIKDGRRSGIFRQYPLLDDRDRIAWPGKYPNMKAIKEEELNVGNQITWNKEYLLRIIDDREPVLHKSDLHYYDKIPEILRHQSYSYATGIDLAISEKQTADFTALVTAKVVGSGKDQIVYILPNPVNKRMGFAATSNRAEEICKHNEGKNSHKFFIEDVMLQGVMVELLKAKDLEAIGVPIRGKDKRTRLELSAQKIIEGKILFPKHGCEDLIYQILNLGVARHDDQVDALTTLILGMVDHPINNNNQFLVLRCANSLYDRDKDNDDDDYRGGSSSGGGYGLGKFSIEFTEDGRVFRRY